MMTFAPPRRLEEGKSLTGFSCGEEMVDGWAKNHAANARKRGTAVVYVCYCGDTPAGFYTLSTHSVARADVGGGWFARNSPDQIPAILLGMMGVDEKFKGQGLGASLLKDAIQKSLKVASLAGARALLVDPVSPAAESFYEHFGFKKLPGTNRMALKLI